MSLFDLDADGPEPEPKQDDDTPRARLSALSRKKRARVLVVSPATPQSRFAKPLRAARMAGIDGATNLLATRALRRGHLHAALVELATADKAAIATVARLAPALPALLIGEDQARALPLTASPRAILALPETCDPRVMIAALQALIDDRPAANLALHVFDDRLSAVPDCGLVFCGDALLPLHLAERKALIAMIREPDRIFSWAEMAARTNSSPAAAYLVVARLRSTLKRFNPDRDYITTIRGKGPSLALA